MSLRIALVLTAFLVLGGLLAYSHLSPSPNVVSGMIEADEIRVGSRVGGRVQSVEIEEGQHVAKGDVLLKLEPFTLQARRQEAAARVAAAEAELERLTSGYRKEEIAAARARYEQLGHQLDKLETGPRPQEIDAAAGRVEESAAALKLAEQDEQRIRQAFQRGAATQQEYDRAREQLKAAKARLAVSRNELELLQEGTREEEILEARAQLDEAEQLWRLRASGFRAEEIEKARNQLTEAQAALASVEAQIDELTIKAPIDGIVEALELEPGDLVSADAPVLSLLDRDHLWMRAYVPQNRLDLKVGQKVDVRIDSFPDQQFTGEITFVSREAEFTPSNVQTPEERVKQVYRIKVTIREASDLLRPGMAGDVLLDTVRSG